MAKYDNYNKEQLTYRLNELTKGSLTKDTKFTKEELKNMILEIEGNNTKVKLKPIEEKKDFSDTLKNLSEEQKKKIEELLKPEDKKKVTYEDKFNEITNRYNTKIFNGIIKELIEKNDKLEEENKKLKEKLAESNEILKTIKKSI